ncbi:MULTISPECIES: EAL domain-containing protein [unclassified Motilimonas]|uniref:EAL domain-containing protein n=1 Tax=Motilimonas TaxID=1914248 RepID=UPI001E373440|nr:MULTISPECIES: EAL domain-containing protein [unclassified Motilimonas]MCE0555816.1 EAL domain-containing protein [Motilimonas sp. E26]MDO6524135.1 EAL domain-containing protein [Motilimonas sp. 1_MG-2023]
MKFTNRYIIFICLCIIASAASVVVGGAFSFRQLVYKQQEIQIGAVIEVIDKQLASRQGSPEFASWLPNLLRAHGISKVEVANDDGIVYRFKSVSKLSQDEFVFYKYYLQAHPRFYVAIWVQQPFRLLDYGYKSYLGLLIAFITVFIAIIVCIRWLKQQFSGAEKLEKRARLIALGQVKKNAHRDLEEWPSSAAKVIDSLLVQLNDAKQERSRFDTYIRANAFVDDKTGLANRLAFENRLDAALRDDSFAAGAVMLVELAGLGEINHTIGALQGDDILIEVAGVIKTFGLRFNGAFYARYAGAQFALLFPQVSLKETQDIANQLCKMLNKVHLPSIIEANDFYYVGVSNYFIGNKSTLVMDDVDKAVRAARLEGASGWYMFEPSQAAPDMAKGSIRWRSILRNTLDNRSMLLFLQPIYSAVDGRESGHEVMARLRDEKGKIVNAGEFLPMAAKVGMTIEIDRAMTEKTLGLLRQRGELSSPLSLNLCANTVAEASFQQWLRYELMQLPKQLLNKLIIELPEEDIAKHQARLMPSLRALKGLGCRLAVDHAGQDVISMQYIKDCDIDILKLHPSLVRDIHIRPMNQVAIRSLIGGCADSQVEVIAVGVENAAEWDFLKRIGVNAGQGYYFAPPKQVI